MRLDTLEKYTCLRRSTGCSTVASRNRSRTAPPRAATVPTGCAGTPSSWPSAATAVERYRGHVITAPPAHSPGNTRPDPKGDQEKARSDRRRQPLSEERPPQLHPTAAAS